MPTRDGRLVWMGEEIDPSLIEKPPPAPGFVGGRVSVAMGQIEAIMDELTPDELCELNEELRQKELFDWLRIITVH